VHKLTKLRAALTFLGLTTLLGTTSCSAASARSTDAPGLRSIAFEHYLSGDTEAALDYYQKAIDTASREYGADSSYIGQLYYEMGTLALDSKKFVRSESYLQKAVQHNPNSVMARVKFAELLQLRGKSDEALQQINAALAKHSSSPEAREALVIWLQANHKTARAIHESYNVTVAAAGNAVAPPVTQAVLAKVEPAKPAETTVIASAAPASQAPTAPPAKVPLKIFPWMQVEKKPEPKKEEPEKKPAEKKLEKKEEKKAVETKKTDKKAKKEPKQQKPVAKEKHVKPPKQADEQVADESMHALRTTAKTIPKKKEKSSEGMEPAPVASAPAMVFNVQPVKPSNRKNTMVPPPPPMVPSFANPMSMFPQMAPAMYHAPAAPAAKVAKKPKPAATAAAAPKEPAAETKSSAASSSGGEEQDPNFLLDWAGANAKKKGK
jgi:tetratricopeptide (TPR) repeat protein